MKDKDTPDKASDEAPEPTLEQRLNQETGIIAWSELVRHFARGVVVNVSEQVDLIEAAVCIIEDNTTLMKRWADEGKVRRASDDDARDWTEREPEFWCVVTAPWVLVQEKSASHATRPTIH